LQVRNRLLAGIAAAAGDVTTRVGTASARFDPPADHNQASGSALTLLETLSPLTNSQVGRPA